MTFEFEFAFVQLFFVVFDAPAKIKLLCYITFTVLVSVLILEECLILIVLIPRFIRMWDLSPHSSSTSLTLACTMHFISLFDVEGTMDFIFSVLSLSPYVYWTISVICVMNLWPKKRCSKCMKESSLQSTNSLLLCVLRVKTSLLLSHCMHNWDLPRSIRTFLC